MEHIPPKGKKGKRLSIVFLVISCVSLIGASVLDIGYRLFYQLIALGIYIFSFELLNRYHLSTYCYAVDENNFIITKRMGKRTQTVCSLSLSTLLAIEKTPKTKKQKEAFFAVTPKASYRYNYCQSLRPAVSYTVFFEFNGKVASVVFEPNEAMVLCLKNRICANKETEGNMI